MTNANQPNPAQIRRALAQGRLERSRATKGFFRRARAWFLPAGSGLPDACTG